MRRCSHAVTCNLYRGVYTTNADFTTEKSSKIRSAHSHFSRSFRRIDVQFLVGAGSSRCVCGNAVFSRTELPPHSWIAYSSPQQELGKRARLFHARPGARTCAVSAIPFWREDSGCTMRLFDISRRSPRKVPSGRLPSGSVCHPRRSTVRSSSSRTTSAPRSSSGVPTGCGLPTTGASFLTISGRRSTISSV